MKLPNRLTYQGSISPSIVTFHAIWPSGEVKPLRLHSINILGNKGSASEGFDDYGNPKENVTASKLAEGNPHEVDYCHIPYGVQKVVAEYSITIESNILAPLICPEPSVTATLKKLIRLYEEQIGFKYLAERYLKNIIRGAWLWRNQKTYSTTITITPWKHSPVTAEDVQIKRFEDDWEKDLPEWNQLVKAFSEALSDPKKFLILEVQATLFLPKNAQFHPSQVFKESEKGTKGRTYQTTEIEGYDSPIFGSYKTGAAIAMIDDWYAEDAEYPLRVNSYGVDRKHITSRRLPNSGIDIYSLLMKSEELIALLEGGKITEKMTKNNLHFLMANLIKGGLFQLKGR